MHAAEIEASKDEHCTAMQGFRAAHAARIEAHKDELVRSKEEHRTALAALGSALDMQRDQEQAMQSSVVTTPNPKL